MHEGPDRDAAHAELRRRLDEGRASARLNQTQLARRAGLGRTTVSQALSPHEGVPSVDTVTALAEALRLPAGELLELRHTAAGSSGPASTGLPGLGRPIGEWDPHELEVHHAGTGPASRGARGEGMLPGYVSRGHDRVLAKAVAAAAEGRSGIVVMVGTSSTGKTRACWEAVQPLARQGWRLWHPYDPTRAEAALEDLHRVGPRTVVWLNEAQHYLGDRAVGERIATAVHHLLVSVERGPVLVLGTLWPEYAHQYAALPAGAADPHSRARELLAGRTVAVPDSFDATALTVAAGLAEAGDQLLADALTRTRDGRVTQDLAGAPELLNRYQHPKTAAARAVLEAAMDARRLGVGLHLPHAFLVDAAPGYLTDTDYDHLTDNWAEAAFAELAEPVHGKQAPLRRTTPRPPQRPPAPTTDAGTPSLRPSVPVFRLADYLEQHGRTTRRHLCPPASFWNAAHTQLIHLDDLDNLTRAAKKRHRLQWAHHLLQRAADHGSREALYRLAEMREEAGDREAAELLFRQAADHGSPAALVRLAEMREEAGDRKAAEALARQAASNGNHGALARLALMREEAGDWEAAELLFRQAADHGNHGALERLALMREKAGDREAAEALAWQAANRRGPAALYRLVEMREEAGDREAAEALAWQAANRYRPDALVRLVEMREEAGDGGGAERLARQAANRCGPAALKRLAEMREEAGDREAAELLFRQAADHGNHGALERLALMREKAGDREAAEALARQAANHGNPLALERLAEMREEAGDRKAAETLARQAANHGSLDALVRLAEMRERAGDQEVAELLALQAANHGSAFVPFRLTEMLIRLWPYGLDPDGTPTPRWQ
ncbi:helix-turn-helix domain-containing protein [Streptomyces sp. NPDC003832]